VEVAIKARFGRERFINIHKLLGLLAAAFSRIQGVSSAYFSTFPPPASPLPPDPRRPCRIHGALFSLPPSSACTRPRALIYIEDSDICAPRPRRRRVRCARARDDKIDRAERVCTIRHGGDARETSARHERGAGRARVSPRCATFFLARALRTAGLHVTAASAVSCVR